MAGHGTAASSRLLSREQLCHYLGKLPWTMVLDRIQAGKLPNPLWRVDPTNPDARWDRKSVDRALDAESSIPSSIEAQEQALDRALGFG